MLDASPFLSTSAPTPRPWFRCCVPPPWKPELRQPATPPLAFSARKGWSRGRGKRDNWKRKIFVPWQLGRRNRGRLTTLFLTVLVIRVPVPDPRERLLDASVFLSSPLLPCLRHLVLAKPLFRALSAFPTTLFLFFNRPVLVVRTGLYHFPLRLGLLGVCASVCPPC